MFFSTKSSKDISERLAQLAADLEQTKGAIRAAETAAAEAVAQGADADFGVIGTLRAKAAAMETAGAILQTEKAAAEKRERLADAKAKRELAQQKRAESAAIVAKSAKLLEKLSEIEGVQYDGGILSAQRTGSWLRNELTDSRIPEHLRAPGEMYPNRGVNPVGYAIPRSRALINEAIALEDEADVIDRAEGVEAVAEVAG